MPKVRSQKTIRVHKEVVKQGMKYLLYFFIAQQINLPKIYRNFI